MREKESATYVFVEYKAVEFGSPNQNFKSWFHCEVVGPVVKLIALVHKSQRR